jgi:hypothetical protein
MDDSTPSIEPPEIDKGPKMNQTQEKTASELDTAPETDMIIPAHLIKSEPMEDSVVSEIKCEDTVLQEADVPSNVEEQPGTNIQDPKPPLSKVSIPIIKMEPQDHETKSMEDRDVVHEVKSVEIEPLISITLSDIQVQDSEVRNT